MPRVLFVAAHRLNRAPSQRFRFEQYLDDLEDRGIACEFSPLLSESDDRLFYGRSSLFAKLGVLGRGAVRRMRDVRHAASFDAVFVQREAFFGGWPFFERALKRRAPLILDFDDAIWLLDVSEANRRYAWLKRPQKTAEIAGLADVVVAGNGYLRDYALARNRNVVVIPTTIDTDEYRRPFPPRGDGSVVCVGWTGSTTTIKHFHQSVPALLRLKREWGDRVRFRVLGDGSYMNSELGIRGEPWSATTEVESLCDMDIGIMPLPHDEWSHGKCGLKGLQFMALGVPVVMEDLGANREIVTDGVDGFLASGDDAWVEKLSGLLASAKKREAIGSAGRRRVETAYSVRSQKARFARIFDDVFVRTRKG